MSHVIVLKPSTLAKYAGTVAAPTTANGAITPDILADGALAIYGIQNGQAIVANEDKSVLIMEDTQTSVAGKVRASDFEGPIIRLYQGTSTGIPVYTPDIQIRNILHVRGQPYVAPTYGVTYIGYDDVTASGSLNLGTIAANSEAEIVANQFPTQVYPPSSFTYQSNMHQFWEYSASRIPAGSGEYYIANRLATSINNGIRPVADQIILQFNAEVVADAGSRTAFANNATVTNGSIAVAETAHGLTTGTFVRFLGVVYKVASVVDANNYTLDRAYSGVSGTIATASANSGSYTGLTVFGIRITNLTLDTYEFAVQGVIVNANITVAQGSDQGYGSYALVANAEFNERPYRGDIDTYSAIMKQVPTFAVPGRTYNTFIIDGVTVSESRMAGPFSTTDAVQIYIAFDAADADTVGNNQANFMDIMAVLAPAGTDQES